MSFDNIKAPNALLNAPLSDGHKLLDVLNKLGIFGARLFANQVSGGVSPALMVPEVRKPEDDEDEFVAPTGDLTKVPVDEPIYLQISSPLDGDFHDVALLEKAISYTSNPVQKVNLLLHNLGAADPETVFVNFVTHNADITAAVRTALSL